MTTPTLVVEADFTGNPTAVYYDEVRNTGPPTSYWRFNSTSTFLDVFGANNGTMQGTPTLVSGAMQFDSDQALSFNGSSNNTYVPSSSTLSASGSFTFSGWVRFSSLPGSIKVIAAKQGSFSVSIDASNKLRFFVTNDNTSALVTTNAGISANTWYHLACVLDTAADQARIYLNGILNQSAAFAVTPEQTSQPLRFAAFTATAAPTWQSSTTNTIGAGGNTTPTGNAPASIASGDLLIAHIVTGVAGSAITAEPSGWLQLEILGSTTRSRVYYKIATGSEPATYQWTLASAENWAVAISRITGQDATAPFANAPYGVTTASGTSHSTGTHTTNQDNNLIMALFSNAAASTWTESATAGSVTECYDAAATGLSLAGARITGVNSSSTNATGTSSLSGAGHAVMLVIAGSGLGYTSCLLDEWAFWGTALTADQIRSHYESRNGGVGAWVDLTSLVQSASGKQERQYELDKMEAGTCTIVFNDLQRKLDPLNTASPFYPNVKTGRRIRVRLNVAGSFYPLFQGYIQGLPTTWTGPNSAICTVTASDGFLPQALAAVSGSLASAPSGTQIGSLLDKAFWPAADRAIDSGVFAMATNDLATGAFALSEIQDIADSELGIYFIDAAGIATFHDYAHRWTQSRSTTSQATFSDQFDAVSYQDLQPSADDSRTFQQWTVTTADGTASTAADYESGHQSFLRANTRSTKLDNPADGAIQATALLQSTTRPGERFDRLVVMATDQLSTATWQKLAGLAVSDKVTVKRNPLPSAGGSTINQDCFIEGRSWNATPAPGGCFVRFEWPLSPVAPLPYYYMVTLDGPVSYWRMASIT